MEVQSSSASCKPLADYVPAPVNDDRLAVQYGIGLSIPKWFDNVERSAVR